MDSHYLTELISSSSAAAVQNKRVFIFSV